MDWLRNQPIAHRGLHSETVPENSLAAVEQAVSAGYPLELDVRLTADGVPVVFHDRRLDRLTSETGLLCESAWDVVTECLLLGTDETVPRLETVLELVDGRVPVLLELKNTGMPGPLETTVTDCLDSYDGEFAIQSFNPLVVAWFRRHRPGWDRGQLAGVSRGGNRLTRTVVNRLLPNVYTRPDFVSYNCDLLPASPASRSKERGRTVLAWTVTDEQTLQSVDPYVDNVIFESLRP